MAKYMGHRPKWSGGTKHQGGSAPPNAMPRGWNYSPPARQPDRATGNYKMPTAQLSGPGTVPSNSKWVRDLGAMGRTPHGRAMLKRYFGLGFKRMFPFLDLLEMVETFVTTKEETIATWDIPSGWSQCPAPDCADVWGGPDQGSWVGTSVCQAAGDCPVNVAGGLWGVTRLAWGDVHATRRTVFALKHTSGNPFDNTARFTWVGQFVRDASLPTTMPEWQPAVPGYVAPMPIHGVPPAADNQKFQYPRPNRRNVPKNWMPSWSKSRPGGSTGGGGSTGDWGSPNPAPPITKPQVDDDEDLPTVHRPPYERPAVQIPMGPKGPGKPVVVIHKDLPAKYPIKEVKWKLPRSKLGDFYGALTEIKDFLEAANAAIPGNPCGSGGLHTRFACVVKHAGQIDPAVFLREAARMQLEDYTIGKANQLANQITKSPYWQSPKGIGFGSFSQRMR